MVFFFRKKAEKKLGKVVVFGATTAVGQPLALLLKMCPHVRELVCCNTALDGPVPTVGVAADISHMDTDAQVRYAQDVNDWPAALHEAQLVLVCSGANFDVLREHRDAALQATAPAMETVMRAVATGAPSAAIGIVSSPVNALTPLCAEYLRRENKFDPRKLFGVTTLDVIRARRLVAKALAKNPYDVNVPVVGGRGGATACPLVAQTGLRLADEEIMHITMEVQQYGSPFSEGRRSESTSLTTAVAPPVALGTAYAAYEFAVSVLKAQRGDYGIVECALVESTMRPETPFFSSRVELGAEGVERILPMGRLTAFEEKLIDDAVAELVKDVEAGMAYAKAGGPAKEDK
ncbi:malate dehydrogenase [Strigomonas culicis]|uniref:Malate dehydrogenase n=1 Tax=Strigomonas culicis TaxID=28005 RepID=S9U8Z4_9TRYP|nr:malate dehydrogenase [Strigomonas culicis]|eukprot:EPY27222.1 malate dehydrogenase [Strigomonas culicis]